MEAISDDSYEESNNSEAEINEEEAERLRNQQTYRDDQLTKR
jgi:hypothetical protein